MRLWLFAAAALALVALGLLPRLTRGRWRLGPLAWLIAWAVSVWSVLRFGFLVPVPASVQKIYLGIAALALLVFVSSDRERLARARAPLAAFLTERRFTPWLAAVVLLVPALVAANIWLEATAPPEPPAFGRTVHPAPPDQILVHGQSVNLITVDNPYRRLETADPEAFRQHLARGREVYYRNCFYCHGDLLDGTGMYATGLDPIPTNFQDAGTIAQFQESYLFWRVAKGGPGLPPEGGPGDSAMPAWEAFLSEEEMWDVILFLYDFTGRHPRARHETIVEDH
jgi:mono/diheme cytochrome c family protein